MVTANDNVLVSADKSELLANIAAGFEGAPDSGKVCRFSHRVFDFKYIYYDVKKVARARESLMRNFVSHENLALVAKKGFPSDGVAPVFISNNITDFRFWSCSGMQGGDYVFPLYIYDSGERISNLSDEVLNGFREIAGSSFDEMKVIDYVYGVLNCRKYFTKFSEFIKVDFPYIPYPSGAEQFLLLADKGAELRRIHLMEDQGTWKTAVTFPVKGTGLVESVSFKDGKVYINREQYFGNVSDLAWNFFIGGYQPAQKWLKDRKGRTLEYEDILHYGRIIYALEQTDRIMKEIDEIYATV